MKLLKKNLKKEKEKIEKRNSIAQKLISLFSRGNINLQRNSYITEEDVNNLRKKVMKYDFSNL